VKKTEMVHAVSGVVWDWEVPQKLKQNVKLV